LALAGGLGYFGADQVASSLYVTTWRMGALYAIDARFSVALDAGMVLLRSSPDVGDGDWAVRPGNPAAMGLLRGIWGKTRYRFGAGGSAPLATMSRDRSGPLQHAALNYAAAIDGLWDSWLWATNRSAGLLWGSVEVPVVDKTWLVFTLAPAVYFPAWEAFGEAPVEVILPSALSLSVRHRVVWFGARVQAVFMPRASLDGAQLSLGPWVRVALGSGFLQARVVANIDEPLAGKRGPGIWGIHLGGGGSL
jgi:hypothetical protein